MIHFINEDGNKDLKGRKFMLGKGIRKHLMDTLNSYNGDKNVEGYKRLTNILSMEGGIDYNEMKRLKNFFDNYNGTNKNITYILNGGDEMKNWINNTLTSATTAIRDIKQDKKNMGMENAFISKHNKNKGIKPSKPTQNKFKSQNLAQNLNNNNNIRNESHQRIIYLTEKQIQSLNEAILDGFSLTDLNIWDN